MLHPNNYKKPKHEMAEWKEDCNAIRLVPKKQKEIKSVHY